MIDWQQLSALALVALAAAYLYARSRRKRRTGVGCGSCPAARAVRPPAAPLVTLDLKPRSAAKATEPNGKRSQRGRARR
jgi:hypothetical protein